MARILGALLYITLFSALIGLALLYIQPTLLDRLHLLTENKHQQFVISPADHRQQHVTKVCSDRQWTSNTSLSDVRPLGFIDDRDKLVYCFVNKVGSISFRTLLGKVTTHNLSYVNDYQFLVDTGIRMSSALRPEKQTILSSYKKMIVVRHPLYRLFSAYQAKLAKPGYWNDHCLGGTNSRIIDRYLGRQTPFNPWNDTISFVEFLNLVGSEYHNGFVDGHWWTMNERCKPCDVRYDLILRLETIDQDIGQLFDYLRNYEDKDFIDALAMPHKNHGQTRLSTGLSTKLAEMSTVYAGIPQSTIDRLLEVYRKDMELFGYGWADRRLMTCQIPGVQSGTYC